MRLGLQQTMELSGGAFRTIDRRGDRLAVLALTDIDGTANDDSFPEAERLGTIEPARAVIAELQAQGVPVGIVTGRSPAEACTYRQALGATGPVICEDGAVILFPDEAPWNRVRPDGGQFHPQGRALVLSRMQAADLEEVVRFVARHGHPHLEGMLRTGDRLASTLVVGATEAEAVLLEGLAPCFGARAGLRPVHLIGNDADKGRALRVLADVVARLAGADGVLPVAFGNHRNDLPLLREVHRMEGMGVLVARPAGDFPVADHELPASTLRATQACGLGMVEALPAVRAFIG